jgi:Mn-dependent DtxR family transcriptional regulator
METHESKEMYLETILRLSSELKKVRSIDVANQLGFSRASV